MHIPFMSNEDLIVTFEVLVRRNLGGERLFMNYMYLKLERNVMKFNVN